MGQGTPALWGATDQSIREIFRLPEAATNRTLTDEERDGVRSLRQSLQSERIVDKGRERIRRPEEMAQLLLGHPSFRALFDVVADTARVGPATVACYFGVSIHTVRRKLVKEYQPENWRSVLERLQVPPPPKATALASGLWRWSYVRGDLSKLMFDEIEKAEDLRLRAAEKKPSVVYRVPELFLGPLQEGRQYLVNRRGQVVGAVRQASLAASHYLDTLDDGGRIATLTPVQALAMPWTEPLNRAPWEAAVREAIAVSVEQVEHEIAKGAAFDMESAMASSPPRRPGGRPRL